MSSTRRLTLDDIADIRAYERERDEFRAHVIALKKRRRIGIGTLITLVFENRDTIRFQIQEMARVEKLATDDAIEGELRTYNPLIPEPSTLSATMFIELTSDEQLREWLPKLVGIERAVVLRITDGGETVDVPCIVDEEHEQRLTRDEVTASVHYIRWELSAEQVEAFARGSVALVSTHPAYQHETELGVDMVAELLTDLRP